MFYYLPAVGELYSLKEKNRMQKFSEDSFAELQQFKPLLLPQVRVFFWVSP